MQSVDRRRHQARRIVAGSLLTTLATGSAIALGSPAAHAAKGPEVIGHRGGTDYGTENSLKTVEKAFARGADAVEIDVQWTRDLRTVVMHDATMNRTSDCSGTVTKMTYRKFRSCELDDGTKAPHVYEMLQAVDRAGKDVYLHVRNLDSPAKARKIVRALNKFDLNRPSRATVISTEKSNLNLLAKYGYKGQRGLLFRQAADWNANYSVLLPYNTRVTESLVKKAQKAGKKVVVVEGHPTELADVLDLGLDGFMANDLLDALSDLGKALVEVESQIAALGG
ncbi:MAG: glycerophosphodiester phosphodiesterase [Sporichthyaceae bacterium]